MLLRTNRYSNAPQLPQSRVPDGGVAPYPSGIPALSQHQQEYNTHSTTHPTQYEYSLRGKILRPLHSNGGIPHRYYSRSRLYLKSCEQVGGNQLSVEFIATCARRLNAQRARCLGETPESPPPSISPTAPPPPKALKYDNPLRFIKHRGPPHFGKFHQIQHL